MIIEVPKVVTPAEELGHVHFVGIGGAGMSGIARIMLDRGITVSGSDAQSSWVLDSLRAMGATCYVGHDAANVAGADTLVVSTAIRTENPEFKEALARGMRILPRAAALASVMSGRRVAAIAGTHGKTTTTSMLTVALQKCGLDPSYAIGGNLAETGNNAHDGSSDLFVAEADESDGSFVAFEPQVAVITNAEPDHLDHHQTASRYFEAFERFIDRIPAGGTVVACADDEGAARLADYARAAGLQVVTYGQAATADLVISDLVVSGTTSHFTVTRGGSVVGVVQLQVPGVHNAKNATAALAAAMALGVDPRACIAGLGQFTGTRRRFELKGTAGGVRVYDDYAHHPTEVAAAVAAARAVAGSGRVIVVFQPHLVSRTRIFASDFGRALAGADEVVVMDVYVAREDPDPAVTGALIARYVSLPRDAVHYCDVWLETPALLAGLAKPGDIVVTMGAGDVTLIGPEVLSLLEAGTK